MLSTKSHHKQDTIAITGSNQIQNESSKYAERNSNCRRTSFCFLCCSLIVTSLHSQDLSTEPASYPTTSKATTCDPSTLLKGGGCRPNWTEILWRSTLFYRFNGLETERYDFCACLALLGKHQHQQLFFFLLEFLKWYEIMMFQSCGCDHDRFLLSPVLILLICFIRISAKDKRYMIVSILVITTKK